MATTFGIPYREKENDMDQMFCFQCEQTAGCGGCTGGTGVCGKTAAVANLEDDLTGALIALAQALAGTTASEEACRLAEEGLFATVTNVDFSESAVSGLIRRVHAETERMGDVADYDMTRIWDADEDTRSLKSLVLFGLRGMAAYAFHARALGYVDETVDGFIFEALAQLAEEGREEALLSTALKVGEVNLTCMGLLDRANTETFGDPVPTTVDMTVEPNPFIIVTGHDLRDLHLLLQQTEGRGVDVYTHGEMLPAHAYPELRRYAHLKGNFGTAWQNQTNEFSNVPGAILFTTNCLMPPNDSYRDRVFTTGVVEYDGTNHIGPDKDFSPVIDKALELGGYTESQRLSGINGGTTLTTGFGRATVLSAADQIIDAVRQGALSHLFLVGGCDGARVGRNYFTEFVEKTPSDTAILTLACGKYRFNDLELGTVGSLPRLLDMGQCNDAYGAIQVAVALADAFECGVNDLPLTLVLSWYEQKAVCILLTLLSLGIRDIYLGPTLPAFISPHVLDVLVDNYDIHPIGTAEGDLASILG